MRTKKRVNELEYDMAMLAGRVSKLEWAFGEMFPKPKRKYVKSGKYTKEAKLDRALHKILRKNTAIGGNVFVGGTPRKKTARTWTDEQRKAQSDRMHKYWAERREVV